MPNTMFFSLLLNIGLLVLIATLLTKIPVVRNMLLEGSTAIGSRASLAVIFGVVSIISTYTGVRAQGAIVNTRVIGVLAAGLLGGPYVGIAPPLSVGATGISLISADSLPSPAPSLRLWRASSAPPFPNGLKQASLTAWESFLLRPWPRWGRW